MGECQLVNVRVRPSATLAARHERVLTHYSTHVDDDDNKAGREPNEDTDEAVVNKVAAQPEKKPEPEPEPAVDKEEAATKIQARARHKSALKDIRCIRYSYPSHIFYSI